MASSKGEAGLFQNLDCVSLRVDDLEEGLEFYAERLGLELLWRTDDACGLGMAGDVTEVVLTTAEENVVTQFRVESVEEALPRFVEAGGSVEVGPFDINIGKCAVVRDKWSNEYCLLDMTKGRYQVDDERRVVGVGK